MDTSSKTGRIHQHVSLVYKIRGRVQMGTTSDFYKSVILKLLVELDDSLNTLAKDVEVEVLVR